MFQTTRISSILFIIIIGASSLGVNGCSFSPTIKQCRIIGGTSRWDASGYYSVIVLVENGASRPIDLENVSFEMTTYDSKNRILDSKYPITIKGEIPGFDNNRVLLNKPDKNGKIVKSRIFMKDHRGQILSEWSSVSLENQSKKS